MWNMFEPTCIRVKALPQKKAATAVTAWGGHSVLISGDKEKPGWEAGGLVMLCDGWTKSSVEGGAAKMEDIPRLPRSAPPCSLDTPPCSLAAPP